MRHNATVDDGRDDVAQAGMGLELIFAGLRSPRALSTSTPPMKTQGWSITPSRISRSEISRMPEPRGMLTTLILG